MPQRHALIIGAMKCGTTSTFHALATHPEIAPCRVKEPHFFSDDTNWHRGWPWYESLWPSDVPPSVWALESSTSYTKLPSVPHVPERIASTRAEYRFLYLVRHPIDRIESHRRHILLRSRTAEERHRALEPTPHLVALSGYARQLDAYAQHFSKARILVESFESLRSDPRATLARVCAFLDIDPTFSFPAAGTTFNKSASDGTSYKMLTHLPLVRRVAKALPLQFRQAIRNRLSRPPPKLPPLSLAQRQQILLELAPDLLRLRDDWGFDTSIWKLDS